MLSLVNTAALCLNQRSFTLVWVIENTAVRSCSQCGESVMVECWALKRIFIWLPLKSENIMEEGTDRMNELKDGENAWRKKKKKQSVFSSWHSHWEHDLKATTAACPSPAHHWACQHWIMDWRYIMSPCASCWANSHWWILRQEGSLSSVESIIVSPPPPVDSSKPIITQTTPGKISVCVGVGEVICIRKELGGWRGRDIRESGVKIHVHTHFCWSWVSESFYI